MTYEPTDDETIDVIIAGRALDRAVLAFLDSRGVDVSPLTGQDEIALRAFVSALSLVAAGDRDGREAGLVAARSVLGAMQSTTRPIARAAVPLVVDESREGEIWALVVGAGSS